MGFVLKLRDKLAPEYDQITSDQVRKKDKDAEITILTPLFVIIMTSYNRD